jgi:hypothetical protein
MATKFSGFHQDSAGDWVAELLCGHTQHVRHRPPWEVREWVMSAEGRAAKVGQAIDCRQCDAGDRPRAGEHDRAAAPEFGGGEALGGGGFERKGRA